MSSRQLIRHDVKGRPSGLILMLHGGTQHSLASVGDRSGSLRRSAWMQRQIDGRAHAQNVSVWLLRYRQRGWNQRVSSPPGPVVDARWALAEAVREVGELPVVLLGHSMGARVAVAVADHLQVTGVVALAPWLPPGEPVAALTGRHLAAAHGRKDRVTGFVATEMFVRRAREVATSAELMDMGDAGHYMLRRLSAWNDFAVSRSLAFLQPDASS